MLLTIGIVKDICGDEGPMPPALSPLRERRETASIAS